MKVCRSSHRRTLCLDLMALHFLNLETSATRLAPALLVWLNLKKGLPFKLQAVERKDGHHFVNKEVKHIVTNEPGDKNCVALFTKRDDDTPAETFEKNMTVQCLPSTKKK